MVRRTPSFCPYCGSDLVTRRFDGRDRRFCDSCEEFIWVDAAAVAHVAVLDDPGAYLQKRAVEPGKGKWGFPAGYLEAEESPYEGAARELEEETNLDVTPSDLSLFDSGVDADGEEYARWFLLTVRREATDGPVELNEEASEWGFFTPAEFEESGEPMSEEYRELFERVVEGTQNR